MPGHRQSSPSQVGSRCDWARHTGREGPGRMASFPAGYFITGTDTGVGKTLVTLGLMRYLQGRGLV